MTVLRAADRAWAGLLWVMMALAALYVGFIMLAIVYVTIFRSAGWDYNQFVFTLIEYGFLYILFLGSPWLVRTRGHVYIELLTAAVPERRRAALSRGIAALCAAICLIWVWYTWGIFLEHLEDTLAFDELRDDRGMRLWTITIVYPVGFLFMAVEFLRFVFKPADHAQRRGRRRQRTDRARGNQAQPDGNALNGVVLDTSRPVRLDPVSDVRRAAGRHCLHRGQYGCRLLHFRPVRRLRHAGPVGHRPACRQRLRQHDDFRHRADSDVPVDGRALLPYRPRQPDVRCGREADGPGSGAVVICHRGRRHRLRHALGIVDGLHRPSRHADGPRDGRARLQEEHVDRPDPRDRRARHADPALGARRAARNPGRDRHRQAADRRGRAGAVAGGLLRHPDFSSGRPSIRPPRRPTRSRRYRWAGASCCSCSTCCR